MRSEDTVICRPVFSCPGWRRSISPEMMVQTLKERFIRLDSASQASKSSPSMSSSKSRERLRRPSRTEVAESPDGERVFVGDKAERRRSRPFEPPRQEHAEALMREPALERLADEIVAAPARKRLDQDLFGSGNEREFGLEAEPIGHLVGKALPIS